MKKLDPSLSVWAILLVGFGTPIFFYTQVYWDHTLAALLAIFALYILVAKHQLSIISLSLVVLSLLIAVTLRVELFTYALALVFAWLVTNRRISKNKIGNRNLQTSLEFMSLDKTQIKSKKLIFPLIIIVTLLIYFALPARYSSELFRLSREFSSGGNLIHSTINFLERNFAALPHLLINYSASEGLQLSEALGWLGIFALIISILAALIPAWRLELALVVPSLLILGGLTMYAVFTTQIYRSLHGFFLCIPYSLIVVFGLKHVWNQRKYNENLIYLSALFYFILGVISIILFRAGKEGTYWPGLEWGQRYMFTLYPLLAILSLLAAKRIWYSRRPEITKLVLISLTTILMIMSFSIQMRGVWMLHQSRQTIAVWLDYLQKQPGNPVVTDEWWIPASLASYFLTNEMYVVLDNDDFQKWLFEIGAETDSEFTYISSSPLDLSTITTSNIQIQSNGKQLIAGLTFIKYSIHEYPLLD
jgi:hypothetical protein